MENNKQTKTKSEKKPSDKGKAKGKGKEKSKQEKKENPKETKEQIDDEEHEFYTPEEIVLLDKFHDFSGKKFEDEEIYEVMMKFNNDEELIKNELKEMLKVFEKGDEFNWTEIGKSE